jgi:hypothetical protein
MLRAKMLKTYHLFLGQCLKDATKFQTLGKDNAMNLSIIWHNLLPFETSTNLSPSSFNKSLERKVLFATNTMVDVVAHGMQDTLSLTRDLTCSKTSLNNLLPLGDHVYLNEKIHYYKMWV